MLRKIFIAISYLAVIAAVVVTTIILVAYGQGYTYSFKTHSFHLNGLLVVPSTPAGASISINGKPTKFKTPYRATLEAGTYDIDVTKDGYVAWHKKLEIKTSEVTYVPEIVLVPSNLKTEVVSADVAVSQLASTRDQRHFAYIAGGSNSGVWILNTDRKTSTKVYTPRPVKDEVPAETLQQITWSEDGSHILVRSQLGPTTNYLVVPVSGGNTVNLTDLFKFDFNGLTFNPTDWRELYWMSPEGLRRINVESQTVSAVLADKVSAFTFAGDKLVYVQTTPLGKTLMSSDRAGRDPKRLIESLAESPTYELQYANYQGDDFLAVLPAQATTATIYKDIFTSTPTSKVLSKSAEHISFAPGGRYLAFYSSKFFGDYDVDKGTIFTKDLNGGLTALSWYDGAHVLLSRAGSIELTEFDGENATTLGQKTAPTAALATADFRRVFWLSGSDGVYHITVAEIKA